MAKPRSPVADYVVYIIVRIVICVIQALPYSFGRAFSNGLAWLAYRVDRRHRQVAVDNLRHAFPEMTDAQIDVNVRGVYRHFCGLIIEIAHLPRLLRPHNWRKYVEIQGSRELISALTSDRPLLLLTGHFGNWEMGGWVLGRLGFKTFAVARTLDNPHLDAFLGRFRKGTGQQILNKNGDAGKMQKILSSGGVIATLADQDAGQRGLYVDFFNRPASTHKAVALLSLQYNAPMVVIGVRKFGDPVKYQMVVEDVIYPEEYEGKPGAIREMTQRFTTALERLIRTAPEQYFWLHRRWKHKPAAKKASQAA